MAATNVQSGDAGLNSPTLQRGVASTSPWSQIVRGGGGESESVPPVFAATVDSPPVVPVSVPVPAPASLSSSSVPEHVSNASPDRSPSKVVQEPVNTVDDSGTEGHADGSNASKKPAWNRPSNGVVDAVSPVMGAAWPALGESTKPTLKSSSSESLKALSDGSLPPALQVTGSSSPSHKQANASNLNSTSTPNHVAPFRQKSMKRGAGANASANGAVAQPSPPTTQDSVVEPPHNASGKPGNAAEQPSPRDNAHKESQKGGFGSQSHSNDHHHPRGSYRRGNGGSYHHNYGGKRDHDRGNQEWNQHSRSFNNRDTHSQSQRGFSRGYIQPSVHNSASFIPPPMHVPVQSFGNNMMFPDVASSVMYVPGPPPPAMPFGAPLAPHVYYAGHDPLLYANIVNQIDYYFSNENLVKDTYLRRNMDEQGWVPARLIAGFKKVTYLTDNVINVPLILDALRTSAVVEVQGEKIRKRNDWMKWIMPPALGQYSNPSSPQANHEGLVSQVQGLALHEPTSTNQVQTYFSRSSFEEGGEETSCFDNETAA